MHDQKRSFRIFQVDAFASQLFEGNPAAVVPLEDWLPDAQLQLLARENNLSETAFFIPAEDGFGLRWFTPGSEVDLCGHATLASAHVLYQHLGYEGQKIIFHTRSGILQVHRSPLGYQMDFPANVGVPVPITDDLIAALGQKPIEVIRGKDDYLAIFSSESDIIELSPDFKALLQFDGRGVIASARGINYDFVSRCFFPKVAVDEDPVTGSAHTLLTPYWSKVLNKLDLRARQLSERGGDINCTLQYDRVGLEGAAITYLEGYFYV